MENPISAMHTGLFKENIFYNRNLALFFWFGLSLYGIYSAFAENGLNNYFIYSRVYYHALEHQNLYALYPAEYSDVNLYGPLFSIIIAPFALLPDNIGAPCWVIANASFLLFAFTKLPLPDKWITVLLFLCAHELMRSNSTLQINPAICACIILGFCYIHRNKNAYALFFIMAATFIKIYGIAGLAFFFFSKNRFSFIVWGMIWSVIFFFVPIFLTGFSFLVQTYQDWFEALKMKNAKNILLDKGSIYQNVSVPGMIRRIFKLPGLNDLLILVPAIAFFLSQYLHIRYFRDIRFRLYLLSTVLIATVIFSTGSESATYIIAVPGMCIWYLLQPKTRSINIFFFSIFALTTLAYSDIFTPWSRQHLYRPYSLKALPPFILWMVIIIQIHTKQFLMALLPEKPLRVIHSTNND